MATLNYATTIDVFKTVGEITDSFKSMLDYSYVEHERDAQDKIALIHEIFGRSWVGLDALEEIRTIVGEKLGE